MVSGKNGYGIYSLNQVTFRWDTYEPHRDKTNKMACAPNEDSDQPRGFELHWRLISTGMYQLMTVTVSGFAVVSQSISELYG